VAACLVAHVLAAIPACMQCLVDTVTRGSTAGLATRVLGDTGEHVPWPGPCSMTRCLHCAVGDSSATGNVCNSSAHTMLVATAVTNTASEDYMLQHANRFHAHKASSVVCMQSCLRVASSSRSRQNACLCVTLVVVTVRCVPLVVTQG
jgi:hypothetical protein